MYKNYTGNTKLQRLIKSVNSTLTFNSTQYYGHDINYLIKNKNFNSF